jgi:hypothetical protein
MPSFFFNFKYLDFLIENLKAIVQGLVLRLSCVPEKVAVNGKGVNRNYFPERLVVHDIFTFQVSQALVMQL